MERRQWNQFSGMWRTYKENVAKVTWWHEERERVFCLGCLLFSPNQKCSHIVNKSGPHAYSNAEGHQITHSLSLPMCSLMNNSWEKMRKNNNNNRMINEGIVRVWENWTKRPEKKVHIADRSGDHHKDHSSPKSHFNDTQKKIPLNRKTYKSKEFFSLFSGLWKHIHKPFPADF